MSGRSANNFHVSNASSTSINNMSSSFARIFSKTFQKGHNFPKHALESKTENDPDADGATRPETTPVGVLHKMCFQKCVVRNIFDLFENIPNSNFYLNSKNVEVGVVGVVGEHLYAGWK